MKEILRLSTNGKYNVNWSRRPPKNFKGQIIPSGQLYNVHGGFGNFTFQSLETILTSIWLSDYGCLNRSRFYSSATVSPIELSCILLGTFLSILSENFFYRPNGVVMNLICTPGMENDVTFEKNMVIKTCDFHVKEPLMKILLTYFGDLLDPFMNAVAKEDMAVYFKKEIYADPEMYTLLMIILQLIQEPVPDQNMIDVYVILLFGNFLCASAKWSGKRYRRDLVIERREMLNSIRQSLKSWSMGEPSLEKVVKEYGLNVTQFSADYKEYFKTTFKEDLQDYKYKFAIQKFKEGILNLKEISELLGFDNISNLKRFMHDHEVKKHYDETKSGLLVPKNFKESPEKK